MVKCYKMLNLTSEIAVNTWEKELKKYTKLGNT